jgi:hypothetical protein
MCDDPAAQASAAVSAEGSKLWMRECLLQLQAVPTGPLLRISGDHLAGAFRRVLDQRHTDRGLVDAVRAVQQELPRLGEDTMTLKFIRAHLHIVSPPQLLSLTKAIERTVPRPALSTAETNGGDQVVQRLVKIVRSPASCATQAEQLRALRDVLQSRHHRVVGDLALILERTFNCREQLRVLNALLRQLTPPTKGTPDYEQQQRSMLDFQRALWAPAQEPELGPLAVAPQHRTSHCSSWSPSDQEQLWTARYDGESWAQIAARFTGRTLNSCHKQMLALDPNRANPSQKKPKFDWHARTVLLENKNRGTAPATTLGHCTVQQVFASGPVQLHPLARSTQHPEQSAPRKRVAALPTGQAGVKAQRRHTPQLATIAATGLVVLAGNVGAVSSHDGGGGQAGGGEGMVGNALGGEGAHISMPVAAVTTVSYNDLSAEVVEASETDRGDAMETGLGDAMLEQAARPLAAESVPQRAVGAVGAEGKGGNDGDRLARMALRCLHATLSCADVQLRSYIDSLYCQLLARLFPWIMLLVLVLLCSLLTLCGVREGHWHAPARRLLALYSLSTNPARIDAGVRLSICLWRNEWVGAAWCALLLACTTPWLARLSQQWLQRLGAGVRLSICLWRNEWVGAAWCALLLACTTPWLPRLLSPRLQKLVSYFGARAEGMFKQLIDAYEHTAAAPSVDQLLKLASHLLDGGLELVTLRVLLRSEHQLRGRLCRWLAHRRRHRLS